MPWGLLLYTASCYPFELMCYIVFMVITVLS